MGPSFQRGSASTTIEGAPSAGRSSRARALKLTSAAARPVPEK